MIKVIDIQNHIAKELKTKFPTHKVYTEGNRADMIKPSFFVSVRPLTSTNTMNSKRKLVNVDISYLSVKETNKENLLMTEELEDLFHLTLKVYGRELYIQELSTTEVDTVLRISFTLDYNIDIVSDEVFDKMQSVDFKEIIERND